MPDNNAQKLRSIVDAFQIPVATVAKVCGVSRPLISSILHGRIKAQPELWSRIESNLHKMIQQRHGRVFEIDAVDMEAIEKLTQKHEV